MWKKAFIILLSFNLLIVVLFTLWWGSLPRATDVNRKVNILAGQEKTATVQLAIGQDAINSYLEYALTEQKDVQKVLSYARVQFSSDWDVQVGIKLSDRVVPCDILFTPTVANGNLLLQVKSATMGEIPVPPSALFFVFRRLPWPAWIQVDAEHLTIRLMFTERPQHPYGIAILGYEPDTRLLRLQITIVPKSLLTNS